MNETRELVNFSTRIRFEDLPDEVVETAKLCVLDTVGVALLGSQKEWSRMVAQLAGETKCAAESGVWGRGWKTSALYAAMANGTSAHGIEMDDRSSFHSIHCGAAVIPASMAAWEKAKGSGKELIEAVVAGYEVAYRVADALRGSGRRRFYGSPIKSLFGATVAAGRLLGLDNPTMLNAVGIAGSMASGLREWTADPVGTMVKRFQGGGWPAHNGVLASLLALKGLTAPSTILEGERGVCRAFGIEKEPRIEKLTENLGKHYMIMQREVKPYGTCGKLQASVDAVYEMKTVHKVKPEQVTHIEVGSAAKVLDMRSDKRPRSLMAAQYSLPFTTALAFFSDLANPSVWDDEVFNRPEVLALAQKLDMHVDEELDKIYEETDDYGGAKMTVRLKDGREFNSRIRYARGTYGNPATSEDVHRKFNVLASSVFPPEKAQKVAQVIDKLEELKSPASLSRALMQLSPVEPNSKK